jgi:hypothetical protein
MTDIRATCAEIRALREKIDSEPSFEALDALHYALDNAAPALLKAAEANERRGLTGDTDTQVFFYEHDFYVLSNFSAFHLRWCGWDFDTSEAAYHWEKFPHDQKLRYQIVDAPSAHEAFKIAKSNADRERQDWETIKVPTMRNILRAKADQHEYVRRKLLATGTRELIEDSWRDSFWGWGPNRDGKNMLGKLWMEVREDIAKEIK